MPDSGSLYQLEAFGLTNPWVLWKIARGGLDDLCTECAGSGIVITSPCRNREPGSEPFCERSAGCLKCRRRCGVCYGRGMPAAPVHAEDFGDDASREIAERLSPGMAIDPKPRSDRSASAL